MQLVQLLLHSTAPAEWCTACCGAMAASSIRSIRASAQQKLYTVSQFFVVLFVVCHHPAARLSGSRCAGLLLQLAATAAACQCRQPVNSYTVMNPRCFSVGTVAVLSQHYYWLLAACDVDSVARSSCVLCCRFAYPALGPLKQCASPLTSTAGRQMRMWFSKASARPCWQRQRVSVLAAVVIKQQHKVDTAQAACHGMRQHQQQQQLQVVIEPSKRAHDQEHSVKLWTGGSWPCVACNERPL